MKRDKSPQNILKLCLLIIIAAAALTFGGCSSGEDDTRASTAEVQRAVAVVESTLSSSATYSPAETIVDAADTKQSATETVITTTQASTESEKEKTKDLVVGKWKCEYLTILLGKNGDVGISERSEFVRLLGYGSNRVGCARDSVTYEVSGNRLYFNWTLISYEEDNKKYEKRDGFTISYIDEMQMTLIDSENKKHVFMKL